MDFRFVVRSIVTWAALALAVSVLAYWYVRPEPPRVNVRWSPEVDDGQRATLETRFRLLQGEFSGVRTWSYRIADTTYTNVETLVTHPGVEDTHGIDRNSYAVEGAPGQFAGVGLALLLGFGASTLAWMGVAALRWFLSGHFHRAPLFLWVLAIFSLAYILFFVYPVFLNADRVMASEADLPAGGSDDGVGMDIRTTIRFSRSWVEEGISGIRPYNGYPPLTMLFYAALVPMPFEWAYALITAATLLAYVFVAFVFPLHICPHGRASPLLTLIGVTGAFSYGLRFEIERGQQNLIAMCLCYAAIVLYHAARPRMLAYALFSIAIQLKAYPCMFVLMFIDRWRALRENARRIIMLAMASTALLFVLGPTIFMEFIRGLMSRFQTSGGLGEITLVNHSIRSAVVLWARQAEKRQVLWPMEHATTIQFVLIGCVLACLAVVVAMAYRANRKGVDVHLLLVSALCAILVPGISHDYTLPVLTGPFAALLLTYEPLIDRAGTRRWHLLAPIIMCSAAYACLLFSPYYRPAFIAHNMPLLMAMVVGVTWLSLASRNFPARLTAHDEAPGHDGAILIR
jgi:hypothetical protein